MMQGTRQRAKKKKDKALPSLAKLITWLDGYAALSCVDPTKIEKAVKSHEDDADLSSIWKQAKEDVTEIGNLPASSEEIARLIKWLSITKGIFLFAGLGLVALWFVLEQLGVLLTSGRLSSLILIAGIIAFYNVNIVLFAVLNRRLNRRIAEYYHNHGGEVRKQRVHLRQVTQQLIDRMTLRVRRQQVDPNDLQFRLFHRDYSSVKILKEEKNGVFLATVEARSSKKSEGK